MSSLRPSSPIKLPLLWLAVTIGSAPLAAIATIVGTEIGYSVQFRFHVDPDPLSLQIVIGALFFGAILGLAQWLVLRAALRDSWQWPVVSMLAFPLAFQVAALLDPRSSLDGLVIFSVLSAVQWLFLRTRARRASLWILFHMVAAVFLSILPDPRVDGVVTGREALVGALLMGALFAIPGAAAMVFMFPPHKTEPSGAA